MSNPHRSRHAREISPPWGLKWRASMLYVTVVIGLGISVDLFVYSIVIPVLPFEFEKRGYYKISALVGWLLFAYSGGIAVATVPSAYFSERYNTRWSPMVLGIAVVIGSQVMFMEATSYWVMILARFLQGVGSSSVWVVGLSLLCDTSPENVVGRQLGIAMTGLSLGLLLGPPIGGALYPRFGFRAPFVFGIVAAVLDLIARLLVIERKDALNFGFDPAAPSLSDREKGVAAEPASSPSLRDASVENTRADGGEVSAVIDNTVEVAGAGGSLHARNQIAASPSVKISLPIVVSLLAKSPRAVVAFFITGIYGVVFSSQEPALPLHLQAVWNLGSSPVGLVFLAGVIPTIFSSALAGWWVDRHGTAWITLASLAMTLPWCMVVIVRSRLALFVVAFALQNFFLSAVVSPLAAELAAVARNIDGVGYAHVYGAFNLVYAIGTTIGPIIGGQLYYHAKDGWTAICTMATGLLAICLLLGIWFTGDDPIRRQFSRRFKHTVGEGSR